jgi:predicted metallopeptidase
MTVWVSQIIRILGLGLSTDNINEIISLTLLALPSYVINVLHLIILFSSFFLNYKLNNSSEIKIINQYVTQSKINYSIKLLNLFLIIIILINSELFSQLTYGEYKIKEVELRNNLNIQTNGTNKQVSLNNEFLMAYEKNDENIFFNTTTIIYREDLLIISEKSEISFEDNKINLEFINGSRISTSYSEKSNTKFEKFNFYINKKFKNEILPDKESFSIFELLENKDSKLNSFGHSKVINYGLLFIILFNIHKVLFTLNSKNSHNFKNLKIIFFYLAFTTIALVLNKFLLLEKINLIIYYFFGILMIFSFHVVYNKIYNAN